MGRASDEEVVRALEGSPWERMRRESEGSGVRRSLCAHCSRREATRGRFCGEFCEVAEELRETMEKQKVWTVKRVGTARETGASSFEDAVAQADRRALDSLILCDGALVASWSARQGLLVLNPKLAGRKS